MIKLNFRRGSAFAKKSALQKLDNISPQQIKNITVVRHAAIGDFMNIRPFSPNAKIILSLLKNYTYKKTSYLINKILIVHTQSISNCLNKIKDNKKSNYQYIVFNLICITIYYKFMYITTVSHMEKLYE